MARSYLPKALNFFDAASFLKQLQKSFGTKFTLLIVSNYLGVKGALNEFTALVQLPFFLDGGWYNYEYSTYLAISSTPWSIKGIGGILSDVFPIFGYEKSSYYLIYTVCGFVACAVLGIFPMSRETVSGIVPMFCFLFLSLQGAFTDLLCQGKYAELMKNNPANRGNIISFSYFCIAIGAIIPIVSIGVVSTYLTTRYLFFIFLPLSFQPTIFILAGCMINDKADPARNNKIDLIKIKSQGRPMLLAFAMFVLGIGSVVSGIFGTTTFLLIYNLIAGAVIIILAPFCLPIVIAKTIIYIFIVQSLYVNIDGTLEYFYTGTDNCVKDGPQFSLLYYRTYVGLAGVLAQMIGVWCFQVIFTKWRFRRIYWVSTVLRCIASIFDIIIVNRWNKAIGIPDQYMYLFGNAIIYKAAYFIDFLPTTLMCAKACPKNIEVTIFAIVAGSSNYGLGLARYIGVEAVKVFDITLVKEGPCSYDNLTLILIIGHFILPLCGIPLTFVLLPDRHTTENFADEEFNKFTITFGKRSPPKNNVDGISYQIKSNLQNST